MTQAYERTATLSELVAEEVRALMARRKVSGRELATQLGVSPSWISYRLSGKQPIDVNDMHRIARALGVGVHELLPPPEIAANAAEPPRTPVGAQPNVRSARIPRSGRRRSTDRRADTVTDWPTGPGRHGSTRPVSSVPATKRRPMPVRPGDHPMPV